MPEKMHVVDEGRDGWFLFKRDNLLLLDVDCNHSAVGYSRLIPLNEEEMAQYAQEGRPFLDRLARMVQERGPGSSAQRRDVTPMYGEECNRAFEEWCAAHPPDKS